MKKATVMMAVLGAVGLWAGAASADNLFEYHGYWRLGFNTAANPLIEAPGEQRGLATTRHTRDPNYYKFNLTKKWDDGTQASLTFDQDGNTPLAGQDNDWTGTKLRVRDLYLSMPLGTSGDHLWAGARAVEFEDLRLFDRGNPFNTDAHGVGAQLGKTQALVSFTKTKRDSTPTDGTDNKVNIKDTTFYVGHEIALSKTLSLKPKFKYINYGASAERVDTPSPNKVKGAAGYMVGAVLVRAEETSWENTMAWYQSEPKDKSGALSGQDTTIGVGDSSSYEFGNIGLLWCAIIEAKNYDTAQPVMVSTGTGLGAGSKTTHNTTSVSLAMQPVYYVTPKFQAAFDVGYAAIDKKVDTSQANVTTLTPILRYAMNKSTLGTPQIYTSVTYGSYDAKVKKDERGKPSDTLLTTQTGFETWF